MSNTISSGHNTECILLSRGEHADGILHNHVVVLVECILGEPQLLLSDVLPVVAELPPHHSLGGIDVDVCMAYASPPLSSQ